MRRPSSAWHAGILGVVCLLALPGAKAEPAYLLHRAAIQLNDNVSPPDDTVRVLVLPAGDTTLASSVGGRLALLNASMGFAFSKGQVLVALECDEPRARLGMAQADLATAVEQHESRLRLQGLQQASDVEVALAASAVAKARSQVDLHQSQVAQCSIRAPWPGQVAKVHVRSHMTITPGQPLLELVRTGLLRVKLNLPSRWVSEVQRGHRLDVQIDETGRSYAAAVRLINSRVDPVSQTVEIEGELLAVHADLLPGMSGVVRLQARRP